MSEQHIQNWTRTNSLTVATANPEAIAQHGPLLHLSQQCGGLSFHHTITPAQARQMAHDLVELAKEAEDIAKGQP